MKVINNSAIYVASNFLNKGISFLLMPIFTYYLAPSDYGLLSLFTVFLSVITPFVLLQSHGAITVEYNKREFKDFPQFMMSGILNSIFAFLCVIIAVYFLSAYLAEIFELPRKWILVLPFLAFSNSIILYLQTYYIAKEKAIFYGLLSIGNLFLNIGFSLFFVVILKYGYEGRILGSLLCSFVISLVAIFVLVFKKIIRLSISRKAQKSILLFGIPLIPHALGAIILNMADRLFIQQMIGTVELGIYTVGYTIGSIIMILEGSLNQAFYPFFYRNLKLNTKKSRMNILLFSFVIVFILMISVIVLYISTPIIFNMLDNRYVNGQIFVLWVALGYMFLGFYKMFSGYLFYLKKTYILSILSILNIGLNLVLNYFLILKFGALGAAYATTISFFVFFILIMIISSKLYPMPWKNTMVFILYKIKYFLVKN